MNNFFKIIFLSVVLLVALFSCNKEEQNPYYSMLIEKNWTSNITQKPMHWFYSNNKYRKVWEVAIFNIENNSIIYTTDTLISYWRLNHDVIEFFSNGDFTETINPQLNYKIIDLTSSTLKVKYLHDLNDSSVLPFTFQCQD